MTNNKQQTAVEILCGKLAMKLGIPQAITFYIDHQEEIREAKEMEKEQIMKAHISAGARLEDISIEAAEEYYKQTYGGGEQ